MCLVNEAGLFALLSSNYSRLAGILNSLQRVCNDAAHCAVSSAHRFTMYPILPGERGLGPHLSPRAGHRLNRTPGMPCGRVMARSRAPVRRSRLGTTKSCGYSTSLRRSFPPGPRPNSRRRSSACRKTASIRSRVPGRSRNQEAMQASLPPGVGRAVAGSNPGGKSGLHWAGCQVTPGGREPTESAAETIPPAAGPVRVKWCGKSAPRRW